MLSDLIAKGVPFHLLVLRVGDLYVLPKGVGHFFFTLHGTTHSVIGMQTVLKRPPSDDVSTITRVQFAALCEAIRSAGDAQEASAPLFEVKASAPATGRLYLKEASHASVTLPVFGEALLSGERRLTAQFLSAHRQRLMKTSWFIQADVAEKVRSECAPPPPPPPPPPPATVPSPPSFSLL